MTLRNFLIFWLFIIAIGLSSWSILLSKKSKPSITAHLSEEPDAFMENIVAMVMNKEGKPRLKLESPKMFHYAKDDTTELTNPHVVIYRQSPEPWHVNANHAKATWGTSEIVFWDNVIIHHLEDKDNPITTMNTSTLTIFPEQKIAKTSQEIFVTQPNTRIQAVGMLANWEEGTVKLLSQAKEEYVPQP